MTSKGSKRTKVARRAVPLGLKISKFLSKDYCMALKDCPECKHPVSTTAYKCQNCGHQTANAKALVLLGAFFLMLFGLSRMANECDSRPDYDYDPVPAATTMAPAATTRAP